MYIQLGNLNKESIYILTNNIVSLIPMRAKLGKCYTVHLETLLAVIQETFSYIIQSKLDQVSPVNTFLATKLNH